MDPLATRSIIPALKSIKMMVVGSENEYLTHVSNLYRDATKEADKKEREAVEKERRLVC